MGFFIETSEDRYWEGADSRVGRIFMHTFRKLYSQTKVEASHGVEFGIFGTH